MTQATPRFVVCVCTQPTLDKIFQTPVILHLVEFSRKSECEATQPPKEGWFTDMFWAGFEGADLPGDERWRALQWLGQRTARDARFAGAVVDQENYILTGRRPLLPPKDVDGPPCQAHNRHQID